MENINSILLIFQVVLSISLITLVLIQHGKGADAGAAFGSGASSTVFGSRGSGNFLSKATGLIATLFFITCMALAYVGSHRVSPDSVMNSVTSIASEPDQSVNQGNLDIPPANGSADSNVDSDLPPAD